MELAAGNLSEGNASWPEPPAAEPRPLLGVGVENLVTLVVFGLIFALGGLRLLRVAVFFDVTRRFCEQMCWGVTRGVEAPGAKLEMVPEGFSAGVPRGMEEGQTVLSHLHKKLKNMSKKSEVSKKKTAQTVLVVVVVFGISWLPHHVIHLWAEFGVFPLTPASFLFRVTAHCLAYSNSSVNPIIYAFLSENFRKAYKQVFKCHLRHKSPLSDNRENKSRVDTPSSTNCTHV
nr:galanin receptor type 1 [Oryctolagus cuniculus]